MAKKKYDWFDISKQQREEWEALCPVNEFRVIKPLDLPSILPRALTDKFNSVLIMASGSIDNTVVYYMANGNRVDSSAGQIDQQPFGLAFVGPDPIPSGSLVQHGDWEDRSTTPPDEFWQYVSASGLGNIYPISELPPSDSGELSDLTVQSQQHAFNDLVAQLRHSVEEQTKESIRKQLVEAQKEVEELGGWEAFKSGQWLYKLIKKSFANYWQRGNAEYFKRKYRTDDEAFLIKKLTEVAARNAAIIGAITGAVVSTNEIMVIIQAMGTPASGGSTLIPLPAQVAIALTVLAGEAVLLVRFQLQLVANIGRIRGVQLDPNDPEDILTILAFALGGALAEEAGRLGMKIGGKLAANAAKAIFRKQLLAALKKMAARIGIKLLQRTIIKYVVPLASIGIGSGWNYFSTKAVSRIADKHFLASRSK